MRDHDPAAQHWHLDKRVNVAMIAALVVQAVVLGTWVGGIDEKVNQHDRRLMSLEAVDDRRSLEMRNIEGRLSSLEANSKAQLETLREIRAILDRERK